MNVRPHNLLWVTAAIAFAASLAFPALLAAQAVSVTTGNTAIVFSPALPQPGERVTAELRSLSADLSRSAVVWTVNSAVVASGDGVLRIEIPAGSAGTQFSVATLLRLPDGRELRIARDLRLAGVDILWSAETSVPPFYKGRRLASPRATVRVAALPFVFNENGGGIPARDLVFRWTLDDEQLQERSGRGKSAFTLLADTVSGVTHRVVVEVSRPGSEVLARGSAAIPVRQPEVVFYEELPLIGARTDRALDASSIRANEELDIRAAPFFFSSPENTLEYQWDINGEVVARGAGQNILSFRPDADTAGDFSIRARAGAGSQQATAGMLLRVIGP